MMSFERPDSESFIGIDDSATKGNYSKYSDVISKNSDSIESKNENEELNRSLSVRQVNMIAVAGVIGTGLYLGTGKSLATGGPLSLLICYSLIGGVVYLTMLSLGEMATYMPVAGSFATYAKRFGNESFGFAILINYWFNDAISVASDLTALQLVVAYWTDFHYWIISLIFWFFVLGLNIIHVKVYGETEYWLALLKVLSIIIFFIISIVVNAGHNNSHEYIGFKWWSYKDAPFVDGFRGFATIFVTASFAYGGTESIALTASEQKNPARTMPKVVRGVFWRIFIFYIFSTFFIGMNVPYTYPNLSTGNIVTSPFTIVFQMVGAKASGSFMNAVILTSVISACNHALYAGSRLMYTLGKDGYFPKFVTKTSRYGVPYVSVLITWFVGGLCFGSSFISTGALWSWLQSIVGVSNQLAWWSIAVTSIRFRKGLEVQGKVERLKFKNWTHPWGPWFVVFFVSFIILVQGWSVFSPFDVSNFFANYLELGVFPATYLIWFLYKRGKDKFVRYEEMDFETDHYIESEEEIKENERINSLKGWEKVRHFIQENFV